MPRNFIPRLEGFSAYIDSKQIGKTLTTVEEYHNAILELIDEQLTVARPSAEQQLLATLSVKLLDDLSKKARALYAQFHSPPAAGVLIGKNKSFVQRAFGDILTDCYNVAIKEAQLLKAVRISDYHKDKGVDRRTRMGFSVNIKIDERAWGAMAEGGNQKQILNILAQEPIDIRPVGKFQGVRCIKTEPYGWTFSTSVSLRLVDTSTSTAVWPPLSLNFDETCQGH